MTPAFKFVCSVAFCVTLVSGCAELDEVDYLVDTGAVQNSSDEDWYRDRATRINWPDVASELSEEVSLSGQPRTLLHPQKDEIREMSLGECLRLGLENSTVIRSKGAFLSAGNSILSNPNGAPSFYDPAIQETGVLFGGRGVEAALSEFDAQFATTTVWGRNELIRNNSFIDGVAGNSNTETASLESSLSKTFGFGGQFELQHNVNYTGLNLPLPTFASVYSGNVSARYRHPLLAGAGAEFTRIAGPIANAFGGLTGSRDRENQPGHCADHSRTEPDQSRARHRIRLLGAVSAVSHVRHHRGCPSQCSKDVGRRQEETRRRWYRGIQQGRRSTGARPVFPCSGAVARGALATL